MNAPQRGLIKSDIQGLVQAIARNHSLDAFSLNLTAFQWEVLSSYMQPFAMRQGQVLIEQQGAGPHALPGGVGRADRSLRGRQGPGSHGAGRARLGGGRRRFFHAACRATPRCRRPSPSKIWCLTPIRFTELSNRNPAVALEIAMALGSLVARRLVNKPKRIAVT